MVIKYSDKFESIFYAVLLNNLTGYFLCPKNAPSNLFENEPYIDIDLINWQQILQEHNQKFGEIKWLNKNDQRFFLCKNIISRLLNYKKPFKYKIIIESIKQALKYGPLNIQSNSN